MATSEPMWYCLSQANDEVQHLMKVIHHREGVIKHWKSRWTDACKCADGVRETLHIKEKVHLDQIRELRSELKDTNEQRRRAEGARDAAEFQAQHKENVNSLMLNDIESLCEDLDKKDAELKVYQDRCDEEYQQGWNAVLEQNRLQAKLANRDHNEDYAELICGLNLQIEELTDWQNRVLIERDITDLEIKELKTEVTKLQKKCKIVSETLLLTQEHLESGNNEIERLKSMNKSLGDEVDQNNELKDDEFNAMQYRIDQLAEELADRDTTIIEEKDKYWRCKNFIIQHANIGMSMESVLDAYHGGKPYPWEKEE